MAVRPDPEVGYRRAGDHLRGGRLVERRVFVQASPRVVWASLHDPVGIDHAVPGAPTGTGGAVVAGGGHDADRADAAGAAAGERPGREPRGAARNRSSGCA